MSGPDRDQPVAEASASPAGYYHHHGGSSSSSLAASSPAQRRPSQNYRQNLHPGQLQSQSQGQGGPSQPHRQQHFVAASEGAIMGARPGEAQLPPDQQQHQQHQRRGHGLDSGIINAETDGNNPNNDDAPTTTAADDASDFPPFEPIFTLLTNTTTNTTVHPRVHYLFSDDDASAVFTAPQTDPLHRALVVDLAPPAAPNGQWSVSWASSLTPDFAVTSSQLSLQQHGSGGAAAAAAGADNGNENTATSVVLRVEGVEREPVSSRPNSLPASGSGIVGRENIEQLVEEFRRRMGVLKKVVDEGERRKEVMARTNEGGHSEEGEDAPGAAPPPAESTAPVVLEDDGTG
ncbi:hypothetical protein CCMA1212_005053 [Trichoderma ghanense]|uniref:Uncharacterized protein n=1 Tax=Trichoderma ghanense TaxID=65468 RepID=A0ABY2H680_9HYPO